MLRGDMIEWIETALTQIGAEIGRVERCPVGARLLDLRIYGRLRIIEAELLALRAQLTVGDSVEYGSIGGGTCL